MDDALRTLKAAETTAAKLTAGLPCDWRAVVEAGLPEIAEIEAVSEALRRAETDRAPVASREREAAGEAEMASRAHDAIAGRPDVPLDHEIAESRARRDGAWEEHRARLDAVTADAFARAMLADDAARVRHAVTTEDRLLIARRAEDAEKRWADHVAGSGCCEPRTYCAKRRSPAPPPRRSPGSRGAMPCGTASPRRS